MSLLTFKITLFVAAIIAAAIFAFLETAFTAIRLFKIKELAVTSRYKRLFEVWEQHPRQILITILIVSNLADVLSSVLVADIVQAILGDTPTALAIGVFLATALILVFGEILPKSFAKSHYHISRPFLWLINTLFYVLRPVVLLLIKCTDFFTRKFGGVAASEKRDIVSEKEIEFLIDYSDEKGLIEAGKSEMLQNIFSLGETLAKEIMIPTTDVVAIGAQESLEKTMEMFAKYRFTRLPVFEKKEDNFIGIIHQKDVFEILHKGVKKTLREMVMPIIFVPETKKVNRLLNEFLKSRIHMAFVVNEHGEVIGIVTLEDILEEIVGEITDEHEKVHQEIILLEEGGWIVDAKIDLEKLADFLKIEFQAEESVTLGGFLAEKLQHLPKKGERIHIGKYCFQIQSASSKRVHQVLVFEEN